MAGVISLAVNFPISLIEHNPSISKQTSHFNENKILSNKLIIH